MATGNPNANAKFLKAHGVILRKTAGGAALVEGQTYRLSGWIACDTCGNGVVSREELARIAGVSPASVSKYLNREPLRPDVAERIKATVKEVH